MFWELYQQNQIRSAHRSAHRAQASAQQTYRQMERLEEKVDALALACQSLWEIVRESSGFSEDHLLARMEQIDLRDGKADGKMSPMGQSCPKCGRKTSRRREQCIYCGESTGSTEVFGRR